MTILVVAAHPDDEVLGCGGAIARHAKAGDEVHVVIMAEGVTSRDVKRNRDANAGNLSELATAADAAHRVLGTKSLTLKDLPDNRLDSIDLLDMVKIVENAIETHRPTVVYTHHAGDLNIDHRRVHDAVVTACRPMPGQSVATLLFFEVASSTEWQTPAFGQEFSPNWFVDISETLDAKMQALAAYQSEMRQWPHARSIEALEHLARWRGASIGVQAAEAFVVGRHMIRNKGK